MLFDFNPPYNLWEVGIVTLIRKLEFGWVKKLAPGHMDITGKAGDGLGLCPQTPARGASRAFCVGEDAVLLLVGGLCWRKSSSSQPSFLRCSFTAHVTF